MRNDDYDKTLKKMDDVLFHYDNAIETMKKMNLEKRTKENLKIYYTNAIVLKLRDLQTKDKKIYIKEIYRENLIIPYLLNFHLIIIIRFLNYFLIFQIP